MASRPSPADLALRAVLKTAVVPLFKAGGFRKSGLSFHRRLGEAVQVVNFQQSHGSTWSDKGVYVNVGVAFDAFCEHLRIPVSERPKEHECDSRGFRCRLERVVPGVPERWQISADAPVETVAEPLEAATRSLLEDLATLDSVAAYRRHRWFDLSLSRGAEAISAYLLGDVEAARERLHEAAERFAEDRDEPKQGFLDLFRAEWRLEDV